MWPNSSKQLAIMGLDENLFLLFFTLSLPQNSASFCCHSSGPPSSEILLMDPTEQNHAEVIICSLDTNGHHVWSFSIFRTVCGFGLFPHNVSTILCPLPADTDLRYLYLITHLWMIGHFYFKEARFWDLMYTSNKIPILNKIMAYILDG